MPYLRLFLISIFIACICSCSQKVYDYEPTALPEIVETVKYNHVAPKDIDDQLLNSILNRFLEEIDPQKKIFLEKEVQQIKSISRNLSSNGFEYTSTAFINETYDILQKGIVRAEKHVRNGSASNRNVNKEAYLETDIEKIDFTTNALLSKRWKLLHKKQLIEALYAIEIAESNLSFEEKISKASNLTKAYFNSYFSELKSKTRNDLIETYMKAYVSSNDSQSTYFSHKEKESWSNMLNRSYVGIGIRFETTTNYPVVTYVMYNGPAWNTGKIKVDDKILKITNHENQSIDAVGLSVDKVIELLKGKSGSTVTVTVKHSNNQIEAVQIKRGRVELSKTVSLVLENPEEKLKVGYINLPRFYSGQGGCSVHVLEEINNLKAKKVDGIILDLRNNKGGRSNQARDIISYFINGGPIMQTVDSDGYLEIYKDEDKSAEYTGKLVVLVNEVSSSASELVSGTLQDYQRAVIVGNQTYGKGTAQNFFEVIDQEDSTKIGHLKLSFASFYTGNGRSVQYHGVTPDIVFPSKNMHLKTGARVLKNQLTFKDLKPSSTKSDEGYKKIISQLQTLSKTRQAANESFIQLTEIAQAAKEIKEHSLINLNYEVFKQEKEAWQNSYAALMDSKKPIVISASTPDFDQLSQWKSTLGKDVYLREAMFIMNDLLGT